MKCYNTNKTKLKVGAVSATMLYLFLHTSCNFRPEQRMDVIDIENASDSIVIVFNKNEQNNQYATTSFYNTNRIIYYTDEYLKKEKEIRNNDQNDTVIFKTKRPYVLVDVLYNLVTFNYYLEKGDSLIVDFKDNIPFAHVKNRVTAHHDINYSLYEKKHLHRPLKMENIPTLQFQAMAESPESIVESMTKEFNKSLHYIDSLERQGSISAPTKALFSKVNRTNLSVALLRDVYKPFSDSISKALPLNEFINNDSMLFYGFFRDFLHWKYLNSDILSVKRTKHAQGVSLDYKDAYDKVKKEVTNVAVRNHLLFYCLQMIHEEDSRENFTTYLTAFRNDVNDSLYAAYVSKNYNETLIDASGSSLIVNVLKDRKVEFADYINQLNGQVVYVDLWASWCVPCRVAMPTTQLLKKELRGQSIVFVYLSLDENFGNWEAAIEEEGLFDDRNSFLLLNPKGAGLPKQIELKSIPRYLIYNKRGELVNHNAPGPTSDDLKSTLLKYLSEEGS